MRRPPGRAPGRCPGRKPGLKQTHGKVIGLPVFEDNLEQMSYKVKGEKRKKLE
jgi:hypothetical protein